jgi:hypothetical protein
MFLDSMLNTECRYAKRRYGKRRYAECRYAEWRGAVVMGSYLIRQKLEQVENLLKDFFAKFNFTFLKAVVFWCKGNFFL